MFAIPVFLTAIIFILVYGIGNLPMSGNVITSVRGLFITLILIGGVGLYFLNKTNVSVVISFIVIYLIFVFLVSLYFKKIMK